MPLRDRPIDISEHPGIGDQPPGLAISYRTSAKKRMEAVPETIRKSLLDRIRSWVVNLWRQIVAWLAFWRTKD
jgi:hypothetical protein